MTTETLEASASEVKPTDAQEVKPTDAMLADAAMQADLDRVAQLGSRERGFMTRVRLDVGRIAEHRMHENCEAFAHSAEERPNIRSQTAKLIAMKFSGASGVATDDKEVYRMVKAFAMSGGLLSEKTSALVSKLPWSSLRVLVRWIEWDQSENTFAAQYVVDVGIKDESGRTTRDIDATEQLDELIRALAVSPLEKGKLVKVLDAKEGQAREAQLVYLSDKQRKQACAAKSMADRVKENEERAALFDGFARRIVNAKLSAEQVLDELFRRGLIPATTNELDPMALSQVSAEEASIIGKLWVQANNVDAIAALYAAIRPLVADANVSQPGKSASAPLDALGSTRKIAG